MKNYTVLNIVPFSELSNWKAIKINPEFPFSRYPLTSVKKFLTYNRIKFSINTEKIYRKLVFNPNTPQGYQIETKSSDSIDSKNYSLVHKGQLIVKPRKNNNNLYAIVPSENDDLVLSNDCLSFDIKFINPKFLLLVLSSSKFYEHLHKFKLSSKSNLPNSKNSFLNLQIPTPALKQQALIVDRYFYKTNRAYKLQQNSLQLGNFMIDYFNDELGITRVIHNNIHPHRTLQIKNYSDLYRWTILPKGKSYKSIKYTVEKFRTLVVGEPIYVFYSGTDKAPSKNHYRKSNGVDDDSTLKNTTPLIKDLVKKDFLYEQDFFISCSGGTTGKTQLYKTKFDEDTFSNTFAKYSLNTSKIIPEYLLLFTQSKMFKAWVKNHKYPNTDINISKQEYLNADIIVPPLITQEEIVKYVNDLHKKQLDHIEQSKLLTLKAKDEFEGDVFGET